MGEMAGSFQNGAGSKPTVGTARSLSLQPILNTGEQVQATLTLELIKSISSKDFRLAEEYGFYESGQLSCSWPSALVLCFLFLYLGHWSWYRRVPWLARDLAQV